MEINVGKWGNSLGLRIPSRLAQELKLVEGSRILIKRVRGALVLEPIDLAVRPTLDDLLARVNPANSHSEFDWSGAVGKEAW